MAQFDLLRLKRVFLWRGGDKRMVEGLLIRRHVLSGMRVDIVSL